MRFGNRVRLIGAGAGAGAGVGGRSSILTSRVASQQQRNYNTNNNTRQQYEQPIFLNRRSYSTAPAPSSSNSNPSRSSLPLILAATALISASTTYYFLSPSSSSSSYTRLLSPSSSNSNSTADLPNVPLYNKRWYRDLTGGGGSQVIEEDEKREREKHHQEARGGKTMEEEQEDQERVSKDYVLGLERQLWDLEIVKTLSDRVGSGLASNSNSPSSSSSSYNQQESPSSEELIITRPYGSSPPSRLKTSMTAGTLSIPGGIAIRPLIFATKTRPSTSSTESQSSTEQQQHLHQVDDQAWVIIHLGGKVCGHEGVVHGGMVATMLDEAMGREAILSFPSRLGVTASMTINYRSPAFSDQFLVIHTRLVKREGRKAWVEGQVRELGKRGEETGKVLTEANALFIEPRYAKLLSKALPANSISELAGKENSSVDAVRKSSPTSPAGGKTDDGDDGNNRGLGTGEQVIEVNRDGKGKGPYVPFT